jgi:tRNA(Ile2) C34 agmatinyltransferase TiaS
MSAAAVCEEKVEVRRERRPCDQPHGVTLAQLLTRAHEAVHAGSATSCPVCGGPMRAAGAESRCSDCGARLF